MHQHRHGRLAISSLRDADGVPVMSHNPSASHVKRAPESGSTCGPDDKTGPCERPASAVTESLPIILGVVIPIAAAIIVFFILHRRHVRKLRREDANDRTKSLDFGMGFVNASGKGKNNNYKPGQTHPLPTEPEKAAHRHNTGLSLDWSVNSPYLLPPGLQGSQESLHSLTRTLKDDGDKYHQATSFTPGENGSMRSHTPTYKRGRDDSSSFTGSSSRHGYGDDMQNSLIRNAQRMSRSPIPSPPSHPEEHMPQFSGMKPLPPVDSSELAIPTIHEHGPATGSDSRGNVTSSGSFDDYDKHFAPVTAPQLPEIREPEPNTTHSPPTTAANKTSLSQPILEDDQSDYGDARRSNPGLPQVSIEPADSDIKAQQGPTDPVDDVYDQYYEPSNQLDPRRLTMGLRPLPPEDPTDNPEQRANRIRSFYKEYFDDTKPNNRQSYYEDYGPEAYNYDMPPMPPLPAQPPTDLPFAQPMGRRAMTPPPRMDQEFIPMPRHHGAASAFGYGGPAHRGFGSMSTSSGPRAYSSISNRMPNGAPRKPMPPPSPLHVLPTPHKLKDDSLFAMDFAPIANVHDRRAGRPETPQGGLRPYMPAVPAHIPLASSYDDLAMVPSPHALRKSSTFTALDFAPPPRFKNTETASDAGSIRSNGTGLSASQAHSIRSGAYRVSRLPAETVGTKHDITSNLRPKWDMTR